MSSSVLIHRVNQLKATLSKELDRPDLNIERCSDILAQLDSVEMSLDILTQTMIGVVVAKYKTQSNSAISTQAKNLIKKWKILAKDKTSGDGGNSAKPPPQQKQKAKEDHTPDFDSLPPNRQKIAQKFLEILMVKSDDDEINITRDKTVSLAMQVELAIHNQR